MANILTSSEAANVLRLESDDPNLIDLLPLVDAFLKEYTGRDWALDTTIHPLAKALARMILTVWHEDPAVTASGISSLSLGIRNLMYTLKGLARSPEISGIPDENLALSKTNISGEMDPGTTLVLVFNHEMATTSTSHISLKTAAGASVTATVTLDAATKKIATVAPASDLAAGAGYTVVVDHAPDVYGQTVTMEIDFETA